MTKKRPKNDQIAILGFPSPRLNILQLTISQINRHCCPCNMLFAGANVMTHVRIYVRRHIWHYIYVIWKEQNHMSAYMSDVMLCLTEIRQGKWQNIWRNHSVCHMKFDRSTCQHITWVYVRITVRPHVGVHVRMGRVFHTICQILFNNKCQDLYLMPAFLVNVYVWCGWCGSHEVK